MAIIDNNGFNGTRKSLGNITFRKVNGKTVASRKITENKSNTPKQAARRSSFSRMGKLGAALKPVIDIGFDRPDKNSKFNNFIRWNTDLGNYLATYTPENNDRLPLLMLWKTLSDKRFTGQVFASRGNMDSRCRFVLDGEGQINGFITLSRDFMAGDTVTIVIGVIMNISKDKTSGLVLKTHTLRSADTEELHHPQRLIITGENRPELNIKTFFPKSVTYFGAVITAIITNQTDRSSSVFTLLKELK
jgi:hypothetical protein